MRLLRNDIFHYAKMIDTNLMMNSTREIGALHRLARLYDVQTAFYDLHHRRRIAPAEALLAVLAALGAPVTSLSDVRAAAREREQSLRQRVIEPVTIAWEDEQPVINISLPSNLAEAPCTGRLKLESGESFSFKWPAGALTTLGSAEVESICYITKRLVLQEKLPHGYHKFSFKAKGRLGETLIISAPRRAFSPSDDSRRAWGAFLPLYALKTARGWGSGDYSGLGALIDWVAGEGGNMLGTLPLLPVFLDKTYDPSPYAPVSRLLWNEFYVDVENIPELSSCPAAQEILRSASLKQEIESLQKLELVDYRRIMALKRQVMEQLCRCLLESGTARREEFRRFARENPLAEDYAKFRAVMEKQGAPWPAWPARLREGAWSDFDYDESVKDYYLYAQWQAQQQVGAIAEKSRRKGMSLYFDLPVGVHSDGYDVWRYRDIFAKNVAAGAPPDPLFTNGQDWGFPPLHPEKLRAQGYQYVIDYLRHHLKYASMLRIDHVMGLHRLYWIPRGFTAMQGVYVRYRAEELYAILALESHRHKSVIVGEDLGIVPSYVRPAMARHGMQRLYIMYYEITNAAAPAPRPVPRNSIASLNTHDMPPFASFWEGEDIKEKVALGLLKDSEASAEKDVRRAIRTAITTFLRNKGFYKEAGDSTLSAFKACLAYIAASRANTVLVNMEDLWLEKQAQNFPGTGERFPSFQRRARYALEEFCRMTEVSAILKEVDSLRKSKR